jgi:nucleoside-diphosphate-sugar epimerase
LHEQAKKGNTPATVVHPGHIVGPGHIPINPVGNKDPKTFEYLAHGEVVELPNFGMETLHHVHAEDVAQVFIKAMEHWSVAVGESFFAVSPAAVTLRGYAETVAGWFGAKPNLKLLSWDGWKQVCPYSEADIDMTYSHIIHCQCCSTEKSELLLGYHPRYTSFSAVREALDWMIANKIVKV